MRFASLQAKIVLGFLASVAVSLVAFGMLLSVDWQSRDAHATSRGAFEGNRSAAAIDQKARSAEVALYRYLNSVESSDRRAMDSLISEIGPSTAGGAALVEKSKIAGDLIQKSQVAAVGLLDGTGNLAQSILTVGELTAALSDPTSSSLVARINQGYGLASTGIGRMIYLRDARAADIVKDSMQRVLAAAKDLQGQPVATNRVKRVSSVVIRDADALVAGVDEYVKLIAERSSAFTALKSSFAGVSGELQKRLDESKSAFAEAGLAAERASELVSRSLLVAAPVVLVMGVAMALLVGRSISRPIVSLTRTMRSIADGDYAAEVSGQTRKDEIGAMAAAVDVFKANGLSLRVKDREADEARSTTEDERVRNEAARAASANEQAHVVAAIGSGLSRLSHGDLTCRLQEAFPGEYRKLHDDFNATVDALREAMRSISATTGGIRSGTSEIGQAADDLSRRTEQQAASLEETAAALDEITATVRKTAEGANHARDVVASAKTDAERSGQVVREAVQAMAAIDGSARQISNIIGVIDEIAFQTNLLALNAGVEAARAGDAGKGFAVVASEVRALAQRSADAAKEIKALIGASSAQVASGVDLVGQTGKSLERIVAQVSDLNAVVLEIAASAKEQATGLAEVNVAVNQMDQVTQQNAAMVEQTTAASHALASEAGRLAELVSHFQVGGQDQPGRGEVVSLPSRPVRPAAATRPVQSLKTTGGRGVSASPRPEPVEEGWEEF